MDFLEASQAVIDCGQNELVLEDICRDSTAPDALEFSLLKSGVEFHWGPEEVEAFNSLKKALYFGSSIGDVRRKSFYRNPY
ncbi:hypothetical protein TNCV_383191 [Trichonephila clavipes]|nr:hypothetical protein TNCV_383191 [Trichonephila clavipes]